MHECNPSEDSPLTHWAESGVNGWTVLDGKRGKKRFVEAKASTPKYVRV